MRLAEFWFRTSLRRRWTTYVGTAVVLGLIGGLALFALAGARRTQSAYPRFLRSVDASTMAVDSGSYDPELIDAFAAIPQVRRSRVYLAPPIAPIVRGRPDFSQNFEGLASLDGRYFDQDRFVATEGRVPNPKRVREIAVNETAAKAFGYRVGQTLDLGTWDPRDITEEFFNTPTPPQLTMRAKIVGIGVFPEEVLQDDTDRSALMLLTPAYTRTALPYMQYEWQGLSLEHGDADVPAVKRAITGILGEGSPLFFRQTSATTFHTQQAVRPLSFALALFGGIALIAGLVLVGQGVVRQLQSERNERATLRALGATPWESARAAALGPILAVIAGALLAGTLAVLASPLMPIGRVRIAEVDRGIAVDWTIIGLGMLLFVVVLSATVVIAAWRSAPHWGDEESRARLRSSRLVTFAQSMGLSPAAVSGVRLATERGRGRSAVPVRAVIGGVAIAIVALVGALTFAASLGALVDHPRLYGWDWDATLVDSAGYGQAHEEVAQRVFARDRNIAGWSSAYFGSNTIDGTNVPILGMEPGASVHPPILEGRFIESESEVVIGSETLARLGKKIGDTVTVGEAAATRPLQIVGTATLPTIGIVHGAYPSLGLGAVLDYRLIPGYDRSIGLSGRTGPNALFVRFRDGADLAATFAQVRKVAPKMADESGIVTIGAQRPAEIVNAREVGSAPTILGASLAAAALTALGLALGTSVRRRRTDLALLKTLGFTRRQVGATVFWQAFVTIAIGLLLGVPVGIVVGRLLWRQFADALNVVPDPTTPWLLILAVAAAALAVGLVAAWFPARVARRTRPAVVLHSE